MFWQLREEDYKTSPTSSKGNYLSLTLDPADLLEIYNLTANSPDDIVATDVFLNQKEDTTPPNLVLIVAGAFNLGQSPKSLLNGSDTGIQHPLLVLNTHELSVAGDRETNADLLSSELPSCTCCC